MLRPPYTAVGCLGGRRGPFQLTRHRLHLTMRMCTYVRKGICVYYMCLCMHASIYLSIYLTIYLSIYACMHACNEEYGVKVRCRNEVKQGSLGNALAFDLFWWVCGSEMGWGISLNPKTMRDQNDGDTKIRNANRKVKSWFTRVLKHSDPGRRPGQWGSASTRIEEKRESSTLYMPLVAKITCKQMKYESQ